MFCDKWVSSTRKPFLSLVCVCVILVVLQYRFNYFSVTHCNNNDKYVKRVVERVYYELTPSTGAIRTNTNATFMRPTENPRKENISENTQGEEQQQQKCEAEKYIMFLKTHKTGSSTITNILNRYTDKNNMSILLPRSAAFYSFDWPNKFRLNTAVDTFARPNFLANHARYSRKSMNALFPRKSTKYISVLRHPVSQWESTFQYMSFSYILHIADRKDPMDFFLNHPPTMKNIIEIARKYPSLYLIRNPLFFDLGLDYQHYDNVTFIRRALKTLDDDFDLVLIMEHFDESLTLLRRRLCWDIDDVVYFKMNERLNKHKRRVMSESHTRKIKSWNNADMVLYNYFVEKFWKEIKDEGPGFYEEVLELRRRREFYSKMCIEGSAVEAAYSAVYVKGYKMRTNLAGDTKVFCERMLKNEIHYMDYFRKNRAAWVNSMEGDYIENFENSIEEVDIAVETPDIQISNFKYGKPSKKPRLRTTPTKSVTKRFKTNTQNNVLHNTQNKPNLHILPNKVLTERNVNNKLVDELSSSGADIKIDVSHENGESKASDGTVSNNEIKYDGKTIVKVPFDERYV